MNRPDLASFPRSPGVYVFRDADTTPVYVGKAVSLRDRVSSYFSGAPSHPRTALMLQTAVSVTYMVCASEAEALLLEGELVSSWQPRFNVRLRHGTGYPGLALSRGPVPRAFAWFGVPPAGVESFGPFPAVGGSSLLDAVSGAYGVRTCKDRVLAAATASGAACLLGETGRCLAPCLGGERLEAHQQAVLDLRRLLTGRDLSIVDRQERLMAGFAEEENFEAAASVRDRLEVLRGLPQYQSVSANVRWSGVVSAVARDGQSACLSVVSVSSGRVTGVALSHCEDDPGLDDVEFAGQVRAVAGVAQTAAPSGAAGRLVEALSQFAAEQARVGLGQASLSPWLHGVGRSEAAVELGQLLGLAGPVERIEAIDVSHLGGQHAVASIVSLADGIPAPRLHRYVRVVDGGDDYAAVERAVTARVTGRRLGLPALADVLLIDGGPEQLAVAAAVLAGSPDPDVRALTVVGLSKRMEEVWVPGSEDPVILSRSSGALRLLMAARDEAHRAAAARHRQLRDGALMRTRLDDLSGVGARRKAKLRSAFGSDADALRASLAELQAVLGPVTGASVFAQLHPDVVVDGQ